MFGEAILRDAAEFVPRRRTRSAWVLMALEALLAAGAYGGVLMMTLIQPDDFLPPEWLTATPFGSRVLPGIGLLLANGVVPTIALVGAARRRPWAALAHGRSGACWCAGSRSSCW